MATMRMIEYREAAPAVRAVYDDIMATRKTDWINNFWKVLASHPPTLRRMWNTVREVMAPGALDPLTKEMLYVAVSVTNNCEYCLHSHTAAARGKGMTDAMLKELEQDNRALVETLRAAKDIADDAKDNATSSLIDDWTDLAERRAWFLFETTRRTEG